MTAWLSPAPVAFLFLSVSPPPQLVVRSRTAPRFPLSPPSLSDLHPSFHCVLPYVCRLCSAYKRPRAQQGQLS